MRVTKDYHCRLVSLESLLERFVERVRVHNVVDEKLAAAQLDDFRLPEMKARIVGVAQDCCYWKRSPQVEESGESGQCRRREGCGQRPRIVRHFRIQEVVSIGYDTDPEHEK